MTLVTNPTRKIFIQLLGEGTNVWRPTLAENLGDGLFKVLPTPNYNPEDEVWEFPPGSVVRTVEKSLSNGKALVAIKA